MSEAEYSPGPARKKLSVRGKAAIALCAVALLVFAGVVKTQHAAKLQELLGASESSEAQGTVLVTEPEVDPFVNVRWLPAGSCPVDFASLQSQNPDIYGWITVQGTSVDHPLLRSGPDEPDDDYYLYHDYLGNDLFSGSIFTERLNSTDFTDPVTMVYGHNMGDGSMFASLHNFEDPSFFDANQWIYIATPDYGYYYYIVSAYRTTDAHPLNTQDLDDKDVRLAYYYSILNPELEPWAVRNDAVLDVNDRVLNLCTCVNEATAEDIPFRYYVSAKLVAIQPFQ